MAKSIGKGTRGQATWFAYLRSTTVGATVFAAILADAVRGVPSLKVGRREVETFIGGAREWASIDDPENVVGRDGRDDENVVSRARFGTAVVRFAAADPIGFWRGAENRLRAKLSTVKVDGLAVESADFALALTSVGLVAWLTDAGAEKFGVTLSEGYREGRPVQSNGRGARVAADGSELAKVQHARLIGTRTSFVSWCEGIGLPTLADYSEEADAARQARIDAAGGRYPRVADFLD